MPPHDRLPTDAPRRPDAHGAVRLAGCTTVTPSPALRFGTQMVNGSRDCTYASPFRINSSARFHVQGQSGLPSLPTTRTRFGGFASIHCRRCLLPTSTALSHATHRRSAHPNRHAGRQNMT